MKKVTAKSCITGQALLLNLDMNCCMASASAMKCVAVNNMRVPGSNCLTRATA